MSVSESESESNSESESESNSERESESETENESETESEFDSSCSDDDSEGEIDMHNSTLWPSLMNSLKQCCGKANRTDAQDSKDSSNSDDQQVYGNDNVVKETLCIRKDKIILVEDVY